MLCKVPHALHYPTLRLVFLHTVVFDYSQVTGNPFLRGFRVCRLRSGTLRFVITVRLLTVLEINVRILYVKRPFVIDGFDWSTSGLDLGTLLGYVTTGDYDNFKALLMSKMNTPARKRNLELVLGPAWTVLRESYESK